MKKRNFSAYVSLLSMPMVLCLMGIVLLMNPDSATSLLSRLLGWVLEVMAVACFLGAIFRKDNTATKIILGIVCLGVGGWLIRHPMALAAAGGLAIGALLILRGVQELRLGSGRGWAIVVLVLGVVLVLLPLTTSRLLFSLCGLALLAAGIAMGVSRLRRPQLDSGDNDPNIIDAL